MKPDLLVLKTGGAVLSDKESQEKVLQAFVQQPQYKILVHGGGNQASRLAEKLGIEPKMVKGRRITDDKMLEVAVMVYAGLINKQLVADLQALECNALGMSGADAGIILAHKRPAGEIDFGYAGDIDQVNGTALQQLLEAGFIPVICSLTHNGRGQLLNTNADTIAAEVASALCDVYKTELIYCSETAGVLDRDETLISRMDISQIQILKNDGTIQGGMLPKLDTALKALQKGVTDVRIGNWRSIRDKSAGTRLEGKQYARPVETV